MLEALLSFVSAFLVSFLRGWLSDKRAEETQHQAGRDAATADNNRATADALQRATEAQINAPDTDKLIDDLGAGRVRF